MTDIFYSRRHQAIALFLIFAGFLLQFLTSQRAFAQFNHVNSSAWYAPSVQSFLSAGYLRGDELKFRPADTALRSEFIELIVAIHGGPNVFPSTASFDDVPPNASYFASFEDAARESWVRGDNNCYGSRPCFAGPFRKVNRAEAAALIARAFGLVATNDAPQFVDNVQGEWYTDVIQVAADHCILQGDAGSKNVRPAEGMNRAEMVAMLDRARNKLLYGIDCGEKQTVIPRVLNTTATSPTTVEVEFSKDINPGSVTDTLRYSLTNAKDIYTIGAVVINPNAVEITFSKPLQPSRAYMLSLRSMVTKLGEVFEDTASFQGYIPIVKTDQGGLNIALAGVLPSTDGIPKGAMGVRMLSLDFTASCEENVTIESVTLIREGQGIRSDIIGLYASQNGKRISRKRIIASSNQDVDLRFTRPVLIPACQTVNIDFLADFSTTASVSSRHAFMLQRIDDVRSTSRTIEGPLPIRGPTMRIATVETGTITIEYRPINPNEVDVGTLSAVVGKFQLSINSVEEQTLHTILLKQEGSASDGDLLNLFIRKSDGTTVTKIVPRTVGDYALFTFDPLLKIKQGDKITLEVAAEIRGGASDTVRMRFEEEGDLYATGSRYGRGTQGKIYGSQVVLRSSPAASLISIEAGKFIVETDGPSTKTYSPDTRDALLSNIRLTPGVEAADIKSLFIAIQGQTITGGGFTDVGSADEIHEVLDSVRLRNPITGRSVSGQRLTSNSNDSATSSSKTYQIYRFDDFLVRGAQTWELRVNFKDNGRTNHPKVADRFRILICSEPTMVRSGDKLISNPSGCNFAGLLSSASTAYQMRIRGLTTNRDIGDVRPRGTIVGTFHSIESAKLSITTLSTGTTGVAVRGMKEVPLLRFEATSGLSKKILFTKLVFEADAGSLLNGQNYALWVDDNGDGDVDTILEKGVASAGNKVIFGKMQGGGYTVSDDTTVFEVRSSVASSLASTSLRLRFAQNDSNFIEAEEFGDGSSLSGININGVCTHSHCDVVLTTATSKLWTFLSQGDLFVTKSSVPVRSRQLLGGTLTDPILRLRFRALNESVDVTDLQISSSGSLAQSIDRLELYREGESKSFAIATVGACGSDDVLKNNPSDGSSIQTFCAKMGSQQLVISGNQVDISIVPRIKTDNAGGISGEQIQLWLTGQAVADNTSGSGAVRARGMQSNVQLVANNGNGSAEGEIFLGVTTAAPNQNIIGNKNVVSMAKIVKIENVNPDKQGSVIRGGTQPFGQFRFTAAQNNNSRNGQNNTVLDDIMFTVSATNVLFDASLFKMYNKDDASFKTACTPKTVAGATISGTAQGSFLVECSGLASASIDTQIGSGETAVFVLEGMITSSQINAGAGSSLEASLEDFSSLATAANGFGATESHIHFIDQDGGGSTDFYWIEYPETSIQSTSYRI